MQKENKNKASTENLSQAPTRPRHKKSENQKQQARKIRADPLHDPAIQIWRNQSTPKLAKPKIKMTSKPQDINIKFPFKKIKSVRGLLITISSAKSIAKFKQTCQSSNQN